MGQTFASLFCLCLGLAALARGAALLAGLQTSAELLQKSYAQEYNLRQCGAKAAAAANLSDSAHFIGKHQPSRQAAADQAARELLALLGEPRGPASTAFSCFAAGPQPLAIALHRQQHRRQDIAWPNWVARIVRARP